MNYFYLTTWQFLAFASFLFFGIQNYLYKIIVNKNLDTKAVTFIYVITSSVICSAVSIYLGNFKNITLFTLLLALVDAVAYYITTISRIEALRYLPSYLVFPIARFSTVLVVVYGVLVFNDELSNRLIVSLGITGIIVFLVARDRHSHKENPNYLFGLLLSFIALVSSAGTNLISKYAALYSDPLVYMAIANLIISFGMFPRFKKQYKSLQINATYFKVAFAIVFVNLVGWLSFLYALRNGQLGTVATISSLAFIVPIVLCVIFDNEKLNFSRIVCIVLTGLVIYILSAS